MKTSTMIEILTDILDKYGDKPVQLFDDTSNEICDVETVRFLKPTDYNGAVLDMDEPAVIILSWGFDFEDDNPD